MHLSHRVKTESPLRFAASSWMVHSSERGGNSVYMQLSEAIRTGSQFRQQAFNTYFDGSRSCALYAAYEGLHSKKMPYEAEVFKRVTVAEFPVLGTLIASCPAREKCQSFKDTLSKQGYVNVCGIIAHLGDEHWFTREQIADWVSEVEKALLRHAVFDKMVKATQDA